MIANDVEEAPTVISPAARGVVQSACATLHDGSQPATATLCVNIFSQEVAIVVPAGAVPGGEKIRSSVSVAVEQSAHSHFAG